jgi:hypothetical protein
LPQKHEAEALLIELQGNLDLNGFQGLNETQMNKALSDLVIGQMSTQKHTVLLNHILISRIP